MAGPPLKSTFIPYAGHAICTDLLPEAINAAWLFSEYFVLQTQDGAMEDTLRNSLILKMWNQVEQQELLLHIQTVKQWWRWDEDTADLLGN